MRMIVLIALLLAAMPAMAQTIYQWQAPDGSIVFSDTPREGAKEVELKPLPTFSAEEAKGKPAKSAAPAAAPAPQQAPTTVSTGYTDFRILSPVNDETLPMGAAGNLTVVTSIEPPLNVKQGHRLSLLIDGTQVDAASSSNSVSVANVFRGTHSLRAVIINAQGDIVKLSDNSVTLHVQRASILNPNHPRNRPPAPRP